MIVARAQARETEPGLQAFSGARLLLRFPQQRVGVHDARRCLPVPGSGGWTTTLTTAAKQTEGRSRCES